MASLVDTNILVYRIDPRDRFKQSRAGEILRTGVGNDTVVVAHQSIVEFVAAATRPRKDLGGAPLLPIEGARIHAERLTNEFPVLYPSRDILLTALRGTAMYGLSWFDAHLWAYAEVYGIEEILSEDFEHGRHYGGVRTVDPFLTGDAVHELPPLYETSAARRSRSTARRSRGPGRTS